MEILDVVTALDALDGTYIKLRRGMAPPKWHIVGVTPAARRAMGQWPTGASLRSPAVGEPQVRDMLFYPVFPMRNY